MAVREPPELAAARRQRLREETTRKGQAVSVRRLALADWTLLVTNVPASRLSVEEALVLVRARWQIELLFKLWKDQGLLDESRSQKRWRRLCELYAKLLGLVLQHWLLGNTPTAVYGKRPKPFGAMPPRWPWRCPRRNAWRSSSANSKPACRSAAASPNAGRLPAPTNYSSPTLSLMRMGVSYDTPFTRARRIMPWPNEEWTELADRTCDGCGQPLYASSRGGYACKNPACRKGGRIMLNVPITVIQAERPAPTVISIFHLEPKTADEQSTAHGDGSSRKYKRDYQADEKVRRERDALTHERRKRQMQETARPGPPRRPTPDEAKPLTDAEIATLQDAY
jgi:hypothetical protein